MTRTGCPGGACETGLTDRFRPNASTDLRRRSVEKVCSARAARAGHGQTARQSGQTIVALLVFVMVTITLTAVAVAITIANVRSNNALAAGQQALQYAESGAENALLRLLRDPGYTGETVLFANGTATISVSGTTTKTIVSEGVSGDHRRTVTVTADHTNNVLTPSDWSETP